VEEESREAHELHEPPGENDHQPADADEWRGRREEHKHQPGALHNQAEKVDHGFGQCEDRAASIKLGLGPWGEPCDTQLEQLFENL
jgi:hypothetical protein